MEVEGIRLIRMNVVMLERGMPMLPLAIVLVSAFIGVLRLRTLRCL